MFRSMKVAVLALLVLLLIAGLVVVPVRANTVQGQRSTQQQAATSIAATVYITSATLQPMFQNRINQQVEVSFNNTMANMVGKMPTQDRGWAQQMADTLIQPSAVLTSLSTQQDGMATSLRLSLYPGDPQPVNATVMVSFSVANASTIQPTGKPMPGSPALVNGPLMPFQIPFGTLNTITTTPTCGDSALAVGLHVPVTLGATASTGSSTQTAGLSAPSYTSLNRATRISGQHMATTASSYVEIPNASLAALGSSVGNLPFGSGMTAKNIQLGVQGSNLVITSDIYYGIFGRVAVATTTALPTASNGNLAFTVQHTTLKIFNFITFPADSYNQQIQQTLNSKLNGALKGKFNVTAAAIGPNAQIPCAAADSLLLTGTANLS